MTERARLYGALENPIVYWASQRILAPGAVPVITRKIRQLIRRLPAARNILDVGCGPASWLFRVGLRPIGADLSHAYLRAYTRRAPNAVAASAAELPFASRSFDAVWTLMMFHHIPAEQVRAAASQLVRVCKPGGYVAILDGVVPQSPWRRPVAALLRRLDRGEHMRSQEELAALLPTEFDWSSDRWTYALTGLEMAVFWTVKSG